MPLSFNQFEDLAIESATHESTVLFGEMKVVPILHELANTDDWDINLHILEKVFGMPLH